MAAPASAASEDLRFSFYTKTCETTPSSCAKIAIEGVGKKVYQISKCYGHALAGGKPVDQACINRAEDRFSSTITDAIAQGDCIGDVNGDFLECQVNNLVSNVLCQITGGIVCPELSKCGD